MLSFGVLDSWKRQAHGPCVQGKDISYIVNKMVIYEVYTDMIGDDVPSLSEILHDCNRYWTPDVHVRTM